MTRSLVRGVLFDFYGTLGESSWQPGWLEDELARHGVRYDLDVVRRWMADAWDGREHTEHSVDEAAYDTWQRARFRSMLLELSGEGDDGDAGGVRGDLDDLVAVVLRLRSQLEMRAYPETVEVLNALRARGLRVGVCSNWDWDLDAHIAGCGLSDLVDARVSSAWVGARKPHRRVFEAALAALGTPAAETLYVGDNWVADVEGARAAGLRAVHVWRHGGDTSWLPEPPTLTGDVVRLPDLRGVLDLV